MRTAWGFAVHTSHNQMVGVGSCNAIPTATFRYMPNIMVKISFVLYLCACGVIATAAAEATDIAISGGDWELTPGSSKGVLSNYVRTTSGKYVAIGSVYSKCPKGVRYAGCRGDALRVMLCGVCVQVTPPCSYAVAHVSNDGSVWQRLDDTLISRCVCVRAR